MPLNGHSYLVSQGWAGQGTGLRHGAISRPLAIPQKKNLAGLGKNRDDAFPFWDHLFTAAATAIQVKIRLDDDDSNTDNDSSATPDLHRTSTGLLSNRRPVVGTPASSGTVTPSTESEEVKLGLLATAKREAARRSLYAKFFRGPVLGPDDDHRSMAKEVKIATTSAVTVEDLLNTSRIAGPGLEHDEGNKSKSSKRKRDSHREEKREEEEKQTEKSKKSKKKDAKARNPEGVVSKRKKSDKKKSKEGPNDDDDYACKQNEDVDERKQKKKRRDEMYEGDLETATHQVVEKVSKGDKKKRFTDGESKERTREEKRRRKEERKRRKEV